MELRDYPRPPADTGWGFHDSAGADRRPTYEAAYARYLHDELGITWFKILAMGGNKVDLVETFTAPALVHRPPVRAPASPALYRQQTEVRAYVRPAPTTLSGATSEPHSQWQRAKSWDEGARVDKVCQQFLRNAEVIRRAGRIPLLPALSPGGDYPHRDWYRTTFGGCASMAISPCSRAAIAIHNRPLNHP